jgi:drug/metabolite transporter (DMT)-like permease
MAPTQSPTASTGFSTGLLYMVGAAFFFSLMSLFVKLVGQHLPSQQIVLVRSVVTLGYTYALLRWSGVDAGGENKVLLLVRGAFGFTALSCFFFALTKLPLADATVIHYTNPVFTALIAAVVLGEAIGPREIAGALLSLVGVTLIAQPSFLFGPTAKTLNLLYVGVALAGALASASAYVTVRKLRETEHPLVVVFYFSLVASIGSTPTPAFTAMDWPTPWEWVLLIGGVAGCAQIAQILLTRGLHAERAGRAMAMTYLQIVFAAVWGMLFLGEFPGLLSIGGALLVISGTLLVARS